MTREDEELRRQLHARFDTVLEEPIPARMHLQSPRWIGGARTALVLVAGIAIGFALALVPGLPLPNDRNAVRLPIRAAQAHVVFASEVRHPVEVGAAEQEHLVKWLSKRLGTPLRTPVLTSEGYELLGGRLLSGPEGPVAQFMYQDAGGKRLTLYVTSRAMKESTTAFRFAQEGPISVFYWIDADCGYALSGELGKGELARVATTVYRQLEEH
jgi:anti-sigma factor RsiW